MTTAQKEYERYLIALKKWNQQRAQNEANGVTKFWKLKEQFKKFSKLTKTHST